MAFVLGLGCEASGSRAASVCCQFRTEVGVELPKGWGAPFEYRHRGFALGSCFSENVGKAMQHLGYRLAVNPFGVVYNPAVIDRLLDRAIERRYFTNAELVWSPNLDSFVSFDCHSCLSGVDKPAALSAMNSALDIGHQALVQADYVMLTYGTSFGYQHKETGTMVANCHKLPSSQFSKQLTTDHTSISAPFESSLTRLASALPKRPRVVMTVSPVRHWKDGPVANSRSKALLLAGIHQALSKGDSSRATYFPAYEILLDELRDYRWYAEHDMLHPSARAIEYITGKFIDAYYSPAEREIRTRVSKLRQAGGHRAFRPDSEKHRAFVRTQLKAVEAISRECPDLELLELKAQFERQL